MMVMLSFKCTSLLIFKVFTRNEWLTYSIFSPSVAAISINVMLFGSGVYSKPACLTCMCVRVCVCEIIIAGKWLAYV